MQLPKPHTRLSKLVLAFDIGTTYSSVSYCILQPPQVPEVLTVEGFPAQGKGHVDTKVPSLLYYDKTGTLRAAGAEVLAQNFIETARIEGWTKAEWWKLHLCAKHPASSICLNDNLSPLPPGKSAVDILTDFIKYLAVCSKAYIKKCHPAFVSGLPSVEDSTEYIFTHPGGWTDQRYLYFWAAVRAGLVPDTPEGHLRVHVITEGEAGLHFCVSHLLGEETVDHAACQSVVTIDAGGGIINMSMFPMMSNMIFSEEIAPAESRMHGSIFITHRARALIERKLEGWDHSGAEDIARITRKFDQTTKLIIESDREPAYIKVASYCTNSARYCISSGDLKLSGEEATGLFKDSVDAIIGAFEQQDRSTGKPTTMVFLVGGLSTNGWIWSRLKSYFMARNIRIQRADKHAHKVVANGAVLSRIYHECQRHLRIASATYGLGCALPVKVIDEKPTRRKSTSNISRQNNQIDEDLDWEALCPVHRHILSAAPQSAHRKYDIVRALSIKGNKFPHQQPLLAVLQIERDLWRKKAALETSNDRIGHLEKTITELRNEKGGLNETIKSLRRETHRAKSRIQDATRILIKITNASGRPTADNKLLVAEFTHHYVSILKAMGAKASDAENFDEAVSVGDQP